MLLVVVATGAMLRAYLFRGYIGLDDAEYARFGHQFGRQPFPPVGYDGPAVFPLRLGATIPTAISFRAFGVNEWSMVLYPFLVSVGTIILAFACAGMLFGPFAGLTAAAIWAALPLELEHATKLLPDLPAASLAALAVTITLAIERGRGTAARLFSGGVLAGVVLGASWLTKETISYLAPLFIIWFVISARKDLYRTAAIWVGIAFGSLAVLATEAIAYWWLAGDPLFRFHEVERNYAQWPNAFFTEGSIFGWKPGVSYARALLTRLFVTGPTFIFTNASFMLVPLIALMATAYGVIMRDRNFLVPCIWFWTLALMFNFASSSVTSYLPTALADRYLYPLVFPAVVLAAGVLAGSLTSTASLRNERPRLAVIAAITGGILLLAGGGPQLIYMVRHPPGSWMNDTRALRHSVTHETPLYADTLTLRAFEFFEEYPEKTAWTSFEELSPSAPLAAGSVVIVNPPFLQWLNRNSGMWVSWPRPKLTAWTGYRQHAFYESQPASWRPLWRGDSAASYRVDADGNADLVTSEEARR
jgi:hypothetical protein